MSARALGTGAAACALLAALWVPFPEPGAAPSGGGSPFTWRQDERWRALEAEFRAARAEGCPTVAPRDGSLPSLESVAI